MKNRISSCFQLAQIRPRAKMSWPWDSWWLRKMWTNTPTRFIFHKYRLTIICVNLSTDYKYSKVVSPETKLTGAMMGVGVFASLLLVSCLILQMPCCRYSVVEKVANLGFGKRDTDTEFLFAWNVTRKNGGQSQLDTGSFFVVFLTY